jgi:hypothetical protein
MVIYLFLIREEQVVFEMRMRRMRRMRRVEVLNREVRRRMLERWKTGKRLDRIRRGQKWRSAESSVGKDVINFCGVSPFKSIILQRS